MSAHMRPAPGPRPAMRRRQITAALEGMTPYEVPDLVFDWSGRGETVQVAIVARDTLAEAESFAEDWGFCPVGFVAVPAAVTASPARVSVSVRSCTSCDSTHDRSCAGAASDAASVSNVMSAVTYSS